MPTYSVVESLQLVRAAFTEPTFLRFVVLFAGWVRTTGLHAVTEASVQSGVAGNLHHAAPHRFFSRARWSRDELGRMLLLQSLKLQPGVLRLVVDDTLCTHKGPKVFGLGCHLDPVRSTRRVRLFAFGHVWVTLAVLVRVPLTARPWAIPVLFRLYRTGSSSTAAGIPHRKKTQLARDMVDRLLSWLPPSQHVALAGDLAYSKDTVLRGLLPRVVFTGCMRDDAALSRPRERKCLSRTTGRPLTKDIALPCPARVASNAAVPWTAVSADVWGRTRRFEVKHYLARWYRAAGKQMLSVVIVRTPRGKVPFRVNFSTEASRAPADVIADSYGRWAIEVLFRDRKQMLGFSSSRARTREAVQRTTPWVGLNFALLVLWYVARGARGITFPSRPWLPKKVVCFLDVLRHARSELDVVDWRDPRRALGNLRREPARPRFPASAA
jgi:hypothetical protein